MAIYISHSPEETLALGQEWGRTAPPGLVIGLTGDLGAGKTRLVQGVALGLGITARISSPTFALVNEHEGGRLMLAHLDLYRLEHPGQALAAGLETYLTPEGLTVIEWVERWFVSDAKNLPCRAYRQVCLETVDETTRRITYEDFGA